MTWFYVGVFLCGVAISVDSVPLSILGGALIVLGGLSATLCDCVNELVDTFKERK